MVEKIVVVNNIRGIHLRPSGDISACLRNYQGKASVVLASGKKAEITASPLSIVGLALKHGDVLTIQVDGENAEAKLSELCELFSKSYDYS